VLFRSATITTEDIIHKWLLQNGLIDVSNMSKNELKIKLSDIGEEQKTELGKATGVDLSKTPAQSLQAAIEEYGLYNIWDAMKSEDSKARKVILTKYPELRSFLSTAAGPYGQNAENVLNSLYSIYGESKKMQETGYNQILGAYQGAYAPPKPIPQSELISKRIEVENRLSTYDYSSGIDHTKSLTRQDYEADLQVEETAGKISSLDHARLLYTGATGKFKDDYGPGEISDLLAAYNKAKEQPQTNTGGGYGIPGAAAGGIFNTPRVISEYGQLEAAVPLDNPSRARSILDEINSILPFSSGGGNTHITVECKIDPNIPFTQDVARNMSAAIGEIVAVTLNGKGVR
jgi:hypothetical protein